MKSIPDALIGFVLFVWWLFGRGQRGLSLSTHDDSLRGIYGRVVALPFVLLFERSFTLVDLLRLECVRENQDGMGYIPLFLVPLLL